MTRKSVKLTNNGVRLTQLWVIFRVKSTDFRVIIDPEWSLAPMDPFPGHADPGVFRYTHTDTLNKIQTCYSCFTFNPLYSLWDDAKMRYSWASVFQHPCSVNIHSYFCGVKFDSEWRQLGVNSIPSQSYSDFGVTLIRNGRSGINWESTQFESK